MFLNILKTDGHSQGDSLCNDHIPGAIRAWPQLSHKASSLHRRIINAKTHFHCKKEAVFGAIPSPHTTYSYILSILIEKDQYFNCFLLLLMMLLLLLLLFQYWQLAVIVVLLGSLYCCDSCIVVLNYGDDVWWLYRYILIYVVFVCCRCDSCMTLMVALTLPHSKAFLLYVVWWDLAEFLPPSLRVARAGPR